MKPRSLGPWALAIVVIAIAAMRFVIVATLPDADLDSYGHFAAARALVAAPRELAVHWVWLPGWHFVLALFVELRAGFLGARLFNAAIAALGPLVLYHSLAPRSRRAASIAALAWALAPLTNVVATSAQSETLFAVLLVCGCGAIARRRGIQGGLLGGACLTLACLLRYEGWAVLAGLAVVFLSRDKARTDPDRRRAAALAVVIGLVTVVVWCVLRAHADGRWFAFVDETRSFVGGLEGGRGPASLLRYTLVVPVKVFGPAWLIALVGFRRAAREAPELARASLGILTFLTMTCLLGGSLGLERHFASLVPFTCVAIGFGVERFSLRVARAGVASLAAMLAVHVVVFISTTRSRWVLERAAAAWIEAHPPGPDTPVVCTDLALELLVRLPDHRFARELPSTGPALIVGWESRLGDLAHEGTLAKRWNQGGPAGAIVVRVVDADRARARPRASTPSNTMSGMN